MSAMEIDSTSPEKYHMRPKRHRNEISRLLSGTNADQEPLELEGVMNVLKEYEDYGGGINCRVCGKLYKSRVCFIKHLWEHSIYWDRFDGAKNHDRVLSIQAALILYNGHSTTNATTSNNNDNNNILSLLVTSPHISDKKKDLNNNEEKSPMKSSHEMKSPTKSAKWPSKIRSPAKSKSPYKRKRSTSCSSTSSNSSTTTHPAMDISLASLSDS